MAPDWIAWLVAVAGELALFAAVGVAAGGIDDVAIDLLWAGRTLWRRATVYRRHPRATAATLRPGRRGRIALFVPAWREEAVIGAMIGHARHALGGGDWRLYVGCYPNDPGTVAAARGAAADDGRVRVIVGDRPGPTTKAGCLNWLWQAMLADERADRRFVKAVVLHDAEDMVHRDEFAVYDALIDRFELVQLPVEPQPVAGRRGWGALVSAHYASEFAEAHAKQVVVREALGAAVPSAGVGCAIARQALARIDAGGDGPFDPGTLTEDYELCGARHNTSYAEPEISRTNSKKSRLGELPLGLQLSTITSCASACPAALSRTKRTYVVSCIAARLHPATASARLSCLGR